MQNVIPHLNKHFFFVCEEMLAYHDGVKVRKNRKFLKALWNILRHEKLSARGDPITVEDVIEYMDAALADTTKAMIKSNIKRGGWQWLEGVDGNEFGERFIDEYIRRCELLETPEVIKIAGRMIDRVNHHNYPDIFPNAE